MVITAPSSTATPRMTPTTHNKNRFMDMYSCYKAASLHLAPLPGELAAPERGMRG